MRGGLFCLSLLAVGLCAGSGVAAAKDAPSRPARSETRSHPRPTHHAHVRPTKPARPQVQANRVTSDRDARGFGPAPTPNQDLSAPSVPEARGPNVSPTVFHLNNRYAGDGYVYGSSPQGMDDRRAATIPGVKLSMPVP